MDESEFAFSWFPPFKKVDNNRKNSGKLHFIMCLFVCIEVFLLHHLLTFVRRNIGSAKNFFA